MNTTSLVLLMLIAIPLASAKAHKLYVSNEKDDTLSIIDTNTHEVIDTIPVGMRPRGIVFSKDYKYLYICASDSDAVQVLDVASGTIVYDLPSGEDPEQFALHPDGKLLYIANEDDAITTVVDVEKREVIAQIDVGVEPEGMAVSPDGSIAITTSETTNMAHWIDTATQEIFENSLVDARPRDAEFTHDGKELWVSSEIGGSVSVFDVKSHSLLHKIEFAIKGVSKERIQPVGMLFSDSRDLAFVALGPANHVAVVNMKSYEVEHYILVGRRVWHMAITPQEDWLYTTNGVSGDVTAVDLDKLKGIKTIKVGRFPWGAQILPDGAGL